MSAQPGADERATASSGRVGRVESADVRRVGEDEWQIVAWLWQCFRHDPAGFRAGAGR